MGNIYGYIRVSTREQNEDRQLIALRELSMHGLELTYMKEAFDTNWMSTVGKNINEVERLAADKVGCSYAVALSAGTAALHLAMKLAGERLYGHPEQGKGALFGHKVFCSDMQL